MVSAIVVDDDVDTREVFSEFLELRGVNVIGTAHNGLEGVKIFEEKHPDIVFSDLWMPDYDGFYLLDTIKKLCSHANVIMVTADLTQETDIKLKKSCADAIIFKPFKIDQIMKTIENLSQKRFELAIN